MVCSLAVDVVNAVTDVEGVDMTELDYVLEDYIDTDALDKLAARDDTDWMLSFDLPGHEVTVTSDGLIVVDDVDVAEVTMDQYRGDRSTSLAAD